MKKKLTSLAVLGLSLITALGVGLGSSLTAARTGGILEVSADDTTVTTKISDYATAHSWANGTQYSTIVADENITYTASGKTNTGKYYTSGSDWRLYQSESAMLTITAASGFTLVSAKITYTSNNTGCLVFGSGNVSSGNLVTFDAGSASVEYTLGNTGSATNGQVRITQLETTYKSQSAMPNPESLTVAPNPMTIKVGEKGKYTATVYPTDADQHVTWSIEDVDPAGCATIVASTGEVTGVAEGSATVRATSTVIGTVSNTASLVVSGHLPLAEKKCIDLTYHTGRASSTSYTDEKHTGRNPANSDSIEGTWVGANSNNNSQSWPYVKFGQVLHGSEITAIAVTSIWSTEKIGYKIAEVGVHINNFDHKDYGTLENLNLYDADFTTGTPTWSADPIATVTYTTATLPSTPYEAKLEVPAERQSDSKLYKVEFTYTFIKSDTDKNQNGLVWVDYVNFHLTTCARVQEWVEAYMHMTDYGTSDLGYCKDAAHHYYSTAKTELLALESACPGAIDCLKTQGDFADALARYVAWAAANGDAYPYTSGSSATVSHSSVVINDAVVAIAVVSIIAVSTIAVFVIYRRKRTAR